MAQLYFVQSAEVLFLKRQMGMMPRILSANLNKLEYAGYVEIPKEFIERKTRTALVLTRKVRAAFKEYRKKVKQFVEKLSE